MTVPIRTIIVSLVLSVPGPRRPASRGDPGGSGAVPARVLDPRPRGSTAKGTARRHVLLDGVGQPSRDVTSGSSRFQADETVTWTEACAEGVGSGQQAR